MRCPLTSFTCPGSKGSIMRRSAAIRRIHLSDLMLMGGASPSGVLGHDDVRKLRGHVPGGLRDLDRKPAPDRPVDLRRPALRVGDHGRLARVRLLADGDVERQCSEQLGAVFPAHALRPTLAEDVFLVTALGADMGAHVLHDPEDGNADFLEHLEALACIDERDVLGRGDDHQPGHRHFLGERELDVSGAGRHVDDEVIDVLPAGDRKSTRLNSSHSSISYAVFCLKKKKTRENTKITMLTGSIIGMIESIYYHCRMLAKLSVLVPQS